MWVEEITVVVVAAWLLSSRRDSLVMRAVHTRLLCTTSVRRTAGGRRDRETS